MTNVPQAVLLQNFDITSVPSVLLHLTNDIGGDTVSSCLGTSVGLDFFVGGLHLLSEIGG